MKNLTKIALFLIIISIFYSGCSTDNSNTESSNNSKPVAKIKANQFAKSGATVVLDGSESSDADNDSLNYSWQILLKPAGSVAVFTSPDSINTSFNAAGEPIVHTREDALKSAQKMGVDALVVNGEMVGW